MDKKILISLLEVLDGNGIIITDSEQVEKVLDEYWKDNIVQYSICKPVYIHPTKQDVLYLRDGETVLLWDDPLDAISFAIENEITSFWIENERTSQRMWISRIDTDPDQLFIL